MKDYKFWLHNLMMAPLVLLTRTPIIALLVAFITLGELAEKAYDAVNYRLPEFKRKFDWDYEHAKKAA